MKRAAPTWAIDFFVREAYELAALRTEITQICWEVDHVVPLQADTVCGLHAHTNLQVIPAAVNNSKHNRRWPDMPDVNHPTPSGTSEHSRSVL